MPNIHKMGKHTNTNTNTHTHTQLRWDMTSLSTLFAKLNFKVNKTSKIYKMMN